MYLEHGIMTTEELRAIGHYPSEERMRKGPVDVYKRQLQGHPEWN